MATSIISVLPPPLEAPAFSSPLTKSVAVFLYLLGTYLNIIKEPAIHKVKLTIYNGK